jgi:outer membrane murein-binding lipoprotein Lpp
MNKMGWLGLVVVSTLGLSGCLKDEETVAALTESKRAINELELEVGTLQDKVKALSDDIAGLKPTAESFDEVSSRMMSLEGMASQVTLTIPPDAWARSWEDPVPEVAPAVADPAAAPAELPAEQT